MKPSKVFCLGFQKTGTTSLGKALDQLGYSVCGYWPFRDLKDSDPEGVWNMVLSRAHELAAHHDAFKDTPWPLLYQEMDQKYPGSRFILVTRETDRWIKSAIRDFAHWPNAIHQHIYGVPYPQGYEQIWIKRYEQHNAEVLDYFGNRSDLIHLRLDDGEVTWENLCGFLGCDHPNLPWPHENTRAGKKRRMLMERLKNKLKTRWSQLISRKS